MENDLLMMEIAERDRRLEKYENPDSPSSTDSLYNAERAAFRKQMDGEDADGRQDGPERKDGDKIRRGPPAGHAGMSHGNKAERTVTPHVYKCKACRCRHLSHVSPLIKTVYDFADDGTMRIKCVAYVIEPAACKRCGVISAANPPTVSCTSLGPKAPGFVGEYYARRSTDETMSYYFDALYGFKISPNTIWNTRKAIKNMPAPVYGRILSHISEVSFVHGERLI